MKKTCFLFCLLFFDQSMFAQGEVLPAREEQKEYEQTLQILQDKVARRDELRKLLQELLKKRASFLACKKRVAQLAEKLQNNNLYLDTNPNKRYEKLVDLCESLRREKEDRETKYFYIKSTTVGWLLALGGLAGVIALTVYLVKQSQQDATADPEKDPGSEKDPEPKEDPVAALNEEIASLKQENEGLRKNCSGVRKLIDVNVLLKEEKRDLESRLAETQAALRKTTLAVKEFSERIRLDEDDEDFEEDFF